ncbi:hypothetical protein [Serratia fonticola]|uniref:hypothetical protein n=1 Tax=Serratia fonticola TaxID=47917 RepID=UPI00192CE9F9|nr:hypothetical protein [Serratia fonticola]
MVSQRFTHENEVIAMAPLKASGDEKLFKDQRVSINGRGELQYDFILHNGNDWHFTKDLLHIEHDGILEAFKGYVRAVLKKEIGGQEETTG